MVFPATSDLRFPMLEDENTNRFMEVFSDEEVGKFALAKKSFGGKRVGPVSSSGGLTDSPRAAEAQAVMNVAMEAASAIL